MGRKLKLTSLLFGDNNPTTATTTTKSSSSSSSSYSPTSTSWAWPSCKHPRTDSFRCADDNMYKTVNSVYFDSTTDSFFTQSSDHCSELSSDDDSENVIKGLIRSNRLFFEPGSCTSSILDELPKAGSISSGGTREEKEVVPLKLKESSVVMALESEDPYGDFRRSMEEMVEAHGMMRDWESLEELLVWYLRVNGKKNHGYIVGAFVDLLVWIATHESDDVEVSSGSNSLSFASCEIEEI